MPSDIEKLQNDVAGLKTQLDLTNTRIGLTDAELAATRSELQGTNTALAATRAELQQTKVQLNQVLAEQLELVGVVSAFAMSKPPSGWLECNGQTVSRTDYARLFNKIGTIFGTGDNKTTFHLPDLRGVFVRGYTSVDGGHDSGRKFGTYQTDQVQTHSHADSGHSHSGSSNANGNHSHSASIGAAGEHSHESIMSSDASPLFMIESGHVHKVIHGLAGSILGNARGFFDLFYHNVYVPRGSGVYNSNPENHTHSLSIKSNGSHSHSVNVGSAGDHAHTIAINSSQANLSDPINARHGNETRPKNLALLFCIKY